MLIKRFISVGALLGAFLLVGGAQAQQPGLINSGTVLGNSTAAARTPTQTNIPALFDRALCNITGNLLVRTSGGWACQTPAQTRAAAALNIDSFTGVGNTNYSIVVTDRIVGTNAAFTASRTWTLPAANAVNPGQVLLVADFQGTLTGVNTLIVSRAGADTINGATSVTINVANGAYLFWSDGVSKWSAQPAAAATGGVTSLNTKTGALTLSIVTQKFSATGTYVPTAGTLFSYIECVGPGGGGGGAAGTLTQIFVGGGGSSGSYSKAYASIATIGASQAVTIGAGGAGGAAGSNNGAAGSADTSVGALCVGKKGNGGQFGAAAQVPLGGTPPGAGTGNVIAATGTAGMGGFYNNNGASNVIFTGAGRGGDGPWGGGANSVFVGSAATAGGNATFCGSGGSAAAAANIGTNVAGGNGFDGCVVISDFVLN